MRNIFRLLPLGIFCLLLASCGKESLSPEELMARRVIVNPYEKIDFQTATRVKSISHEHIYNKSQLKYAYDRGIRFFCCVNYMPACPSYPLSDWSYEYEDYVSPTDLKLTKFTYEGRIPSFVDKDGNKIDTDDLIQLPNAEHVNYGNTGGMHFCVIGSLFGECAYGDRKGAEWSDDALGMKKSVWYLTHPKWDIKDINTQYLDQSKQLFKGKVFGTLNHTTDETDVRNMLKKCPDVFKAMEIVNQGSTEERRVKFRELWDKLLSDNIRIWGTSVVDWQTDGPDGKPKLGACNVLLIEDYDSHTNLEKAEMGLDAYIAGCYIPAGLADNDIVDFKADKVSVRLEVTGTPTQMIVVTNRGKTEYENINVVEYSYGAKDTYVRFEVWYRDNDGTLQDYLFTNPIFIGYQDK